MSHPQSFHSNFRQIAGGLTPARAAHLWKSRFEFVAQFLRFNYTEIEAETNRGENDQKLVQRYSRRRK
jgi:hypothetical protein